MISLENTKCETKDRAPGQKQWFFVSAIYFGLITTLSHIPGHAIASLGFNIWDKAAHFAVYAVLGLFLGLGFFHRFGQRKGRILLFTSLVVLTLGALDETHQLFVDGRFASVDDWIADGLGGVFGGLWALTPYPLAVLNHLRISKPMKRKSAS